MASKATSPNPSSLDGMRTTRDCHRSCRKDSSLVENGRAMTVVAGATIESSRSLTASPSGAGTPRTTSVGLSPRSCSNFENGESNAARRYVDTFCQYIFRPSHEEYLPTSRRVGRIDNGAPVSKSWSKIDDWRGLLPEAAHCVLDHFRQRRAHPCNHIRGYEDVPLTV